MAGRIKLNSKAVQELLKSPGVRADLKRRAEAIATAAGEGFEVDESVGAKRARAAVYTGNREAMEAEADHKVLRRAIDAGRH